VTRVLSGAVLIAIAVAVVWFAPPLVFLLAAAVLVVLGVNELVLLARASGLDMSFWPVLAATLLTAAIVGLPAAYPIEVPLIPLELPLMGFMVGLGLVALASWRGGPQALASVSASLFPSLYLGLPIGALVVIRERGGPQMLFLLMLTVIVSDTAQYYSGRLFGRRPLAPMVSPKKTIEGAIGGFVVGAAVFAAAGAWWLPDMPVALRAALGLTLVALGIAGDLFESMLKRSASVKDSSALIPGHGGVLDRIDALLFAAPIYYVVLQHV
jgi:phosphatidate cytidylyltransferase